jgi:hypothetical protein
MCFAEAYLISSDISSEPVGYDWDYFSLSPQSRGKFIPSGDGFSSELVMFVSDFLSEVDVPDLCFIREAHSRNRSSSMINKMEKKSTAPEIYSFPTPSKMVFGRSSVVRMIRLCTAREKRYGLMVVLWPETNIVDTDQPRTTRKHPQARSSRRLAIMFGRGRSNAGVLVAPKAEFRVDPANDVELARFRNLIWYFISLNCNLSVQPTTFLGQQ